MNSSLFWQYQHGIVVYIRLPEADTTNDAFWSEVSYNIIAITLHVILIDAS